VGTARKERRGARNTTQGGQWWKETRRKELKQGLASAGVIILNLMSTEWKRKIFEDVSISI